jgi:hypothetical protein
MIANLQQIPTWLWIIAILVILLVSALVIWLRRHKFHITKFELTGGPLKATLEPGKAQESQSPAATPFPASINISGNKLFGINKLRIRRQDTNISGNLLAGENEIEVGAKPGSKPKAKKERQSK